VNWFSFTVPQDKREPSFFERRVSYEPHESRLLLRAGALLPRQASPARPTPRFAHRRALAATEWGICTECGMPAPSGPTSPPCLKAPGDPGAYAR